jgi:hypothetical protein
MISWCHATNNDYNLDANAYSTTHIFKLLKNNGHSFKITIKKTHHLWPYSWSSRGNLDLETQHKGTLLEECIQKYMSCKRLQKRLILIIKSLDDLGTSIITIQAQCNKKYYFPLNRNNNCNCKLQN